MTKETRSYSASTKTAVRYKVLEPNLVVSTRVRLRLSDTSLDLIILNRPKSVVIKKNPHKTKIFKKEI